MKTFLEGLGERGRTGSIDGFGREGGGGTGSIGGYLKSTFRGLLLLYPNINSVK